MAGTDIPKEVYEHSRYRCSLQEIPRDRVPIGYSETYLGVKKRYLPSKYFTSPDTARVDRAARRVDGGSKNANRKLMRSVRRSLSSGVLGRGRVKRIRSRGKDREWDEERRAEREGLTDRPREEQRESGKERERERGTARVRGRTGTRGIQQLPLNVFNAAVEARKRSVGRSHRSAPRRPRGGDGTVWAGRSGGALASCSSWTSVSLYTYREVLPSPGRFKHDGIQTLRLYELPPLSRERQRRHRDRPTCVGEDWKRTERGTADRRFTRLTAERMRVDWASRLFEPSNLTDGSPPSASVSFRFRDGTSPTH